MWASRRSTDENLNILLPPAHLAQAWALQQPKKRGEVQPLGKRVNQDGGLCAGGLNQAQYRPKGGFAYELRIHRQAWLVGDGGAKIFQRRIGGDESMGGDVRAMGRPRSFYRLSTGFFFSCRPFLIGYKMAA